ncbi:MAG: serine/threonine protein kinase, partial [Prevotella sp.]|nr:serine/threonine protein kinase [Prevotella sp.]
GSDIAGTQYDVAHVKWGGSWVMPSHAQQVELLNYCTSTWTTENGVYGRRFTGSNGGSIFMPAAGGRWNGDLNSAGSWGDYWSSTQNPSYSTDAYYLYFSSGSAGWSYGYRDGGQSVRPVVRN